MSAEIVFGLLGMVCSVFLTLSFQAHQKAVKAVKEAKEAVASVEDLCDLIRKHNKDLISQRKVQGDAFAAEYDKRIQKLEQRIEDLNSRVASLQMKR